MDWKYLFTSFNGRIGRQQWWLGTIVLVVTVWIIIFIIGMIIASSMPMPAEGEMPDSVSPVMIIVSIIIYIPFVWASLALSAKRWHDRDKSAWWILINLVPIIGGLWALIENGFLKGTEGANQYGADPVPS